MHASGEMILFTAVGAAALWAKWGRQKLRVWLFSDLIELVPVNERWRPLIEFLVFISLGCVVGIGFVNPSTPAQALTAGFGWTGLFAELPKKTGRDTGRRRRKKSESEV